MRRLVPLALALVQTAGAAEVSVRVLELFHPKRVELAAPEGGRTILVTSRGRRSIEGGQSAGIDLSTVAGGARVQGPAVVRIEGRIERTFAGELTIERDGDELKLVTRLPLEQAVSAIVAAESGESSPPQARRAQAIATRSFLLAAKGRHHGYDFCDTTHCQHFTAASYASREAAEATAGLVLEHNGLILEALSTRRCGGSTRTLADIGLRGEDYPYFPVACEPCRRRPSPWRRSWPRAKLAPILAQPGFENARLEVVRVLGWSAIPSNAYTLGAVGNEAHLSGEGEGHGVGLCQFGAAELAAHGWDAARILRHYFVNTKIAKR